MRPTALRATREALDRAAPRSLADNRHPQHAVMRQSAAGLARKLGSVQAPEATGTARELTRTGLTSDRGFLVHRAAPAGSPNGGDESYVA